MSAEFNKFMINNLSRHQLRGLILGGARREGCCSWQLKAFEIAIDNKFNLEQSKNLEQLQRDVLNEDLDF